MEAFLKDARDPSSTFESLYRMHKEFIDAFDGEIMDHKDVQKTFPHLFDATGGRGRQRARSKPRKGKGTPLGRSDYMKILALLTLALSAMYLDQRSEQQLRGVQRRHRPNPLKQLLYNMEHASCDNLSKTYRQAALKTHPDKKGGSDTAFHKLREKYIDEKDLCRHKPKARRRRNDRRNGKGRRKPGKRARHQHRGRMEEESILRF